MPCFTDQISARGPSPERGSYDEVLLTSRFRKAHVFLNPNLLTGTLEDVIRFANGISSYLHQHGLVMNSERQKRAMPHQQEYMVVIPGWVVALGVNPDSGVAISVTS